MQFAILLDNQGYIFFEFSVNVISKRYSMLRQQIAAVVHLITTLVLFREGMPSFKRSELKIRLNVYQNKGNEKNENFCTTVTSATLRMVKNII